MLSHHHAKYGGVRYCGSGNIMILVAERQNSASSHLSLPLLFFL